MSSNIRSDVRRPGTGISASAAAFIVLEGAPAARTEGVFSSLQASRKLDDLKILPLPMNCRWII